MPYVISENIFNNKASRYLLSTFLTVTFEAFTIVIYAKSCEEWLNMGWSEGGDLGKSSNVCDISGISFPIEGAAIGSFTNGARGRGKYKGWLENKCKYIIQLYDY